MKGKYFDRTMVTKGISIDYNEKTVKFEDPDGEEEEKERDYWNIMYEMGPVYLAVVCVIAVFITAGIFIYWFASMAGVIQSEMIVANKIEYQKGIVGVNCLNYDSIFSEKDILGECRGHIETSCGITLMSSMLVLPWMGISFLLYKKVIEIEPFLIKCDYLENVHIFGIREKTKMEINKINGKTFTIPKFENYYLEFKAKGEFGKYLERIEIREREEDRESIDREWYAKFYFSEVPQRGVLKICYI